MTSRSKMVGSRADKAGKVTSAPTPAVTQEIVPGKYNDQDWNLMLDHDDGDDFISDVVGDICNSAIDVIFQNYVQKQLVPYTVAQAKDAILQIIEWQFLARDEGESGFEADAGWVQDEEPEPALTDCWAQGAVPRQMTTPRTPSAVHMILEEDEEAEPQPMEMPISPGSSAAAEAQQVEEEEGGSRIGKDDEEEEEDEEDEEEWTATEEDSVPVEESMQDEASTKEEQEEEEIQEEQPPDPAETKKKKKKAYKRHTGRVGSAGVSKMTQSLEQAEMQMLCEEAYAPSPLGSPDPTMMQMPASCHSILKLQNGRPPGNRDILYDESGNVISVTRLDPDRLPSHKVRTLYHVVDPAVEAAQAQLEAMRTGRYLKKSGATQKRAPQPPDSSRSSLSRTTVGKNTVRTHKTDDSKAANYGRAKDGVTLLPPPLIESMEVSPGVVVREGDRVKAGPRQHPRKAELIASATQRGLRPLTVRANVPTLTVAQLLEHHTPVVKPLVDSPPIPPISAHRQISSQ